MKSTLSCLLLLSASRRSGNSCQAFVVVNPHSNAAAVPFRRSTRLYIEEEIADMIDRELYRQQHLQDFENEWMEKNRDAVLARLNSDDYMLTNMDEDELRENFRQMQKDKKLAQKDPYAYCADRCITTGNCDVYEDLFELSPDEVVKFCTNCVMGGEEEECEIPDAFYSFIDDFGYEKQQQPSTDNNDRK